jgi:hypothetical protein
VRIPAAMFAYASGMSVNHLNRKEGKNTGVRAKNLQIEILEEEKKQIPLQAQTRGIVPFSYMKEFHV